MARKQVSSVKRTITPETLLYGLYVDIITLHGAMLKEANAQTLWAADAAKPILERLKACTTVQSLLNHVATIDQCAQLVNNRREKVSDEET